MRQDEHNDRDDPYARVLAETMAFYKRKAKFYGTLMFFNLVAFALMRKGMPAYALWPYLGTILGISLVYLLAVSGFYATALLFDWLDARQRH